MGLLWDIIDIFVIDRIKESKKLKQSGPLSGVGKVDLDTYVVPTSTDIPPRPEMATPTDGNMSVAIHQTDDSVWVWILVSEVTKHTLAGVLKVPVDEYPSDPDAQARMFRNYQRQTQNIADVAPQHYDEWEQKEDLANAKAMFSKPDHIYLSNMLANPFRYRVADAHQAAEYVARLKAKVLPKIKEIIQAQSQPKTESFEL